MDGINNGILENNRAGSRTLGRTWARLNSVSSELRRKIHPRATLVLAIDLVLCAISFPAALLLRLSPTDLTQFREYQDATLVAIPIIVALGFLIFSVSGLYKAFWRYVSLSDVVHVAKAAGLAIVAFGLLLFLINRLQAVPRSVPIIQYLLLVTLMTGSRVLYREVASRGLKLHSRDPWRVPTLVVGVNANSELFIRATSNNPNAAFEVIAVLDWDGRNVGRSVHRVPVMGKVGDREQIIQCIVQMKVRPQRILISEQHPRFDVEGLFAAAESLGLGVAYLPSPGELLRSGKPGNSGFKDVMSQDLLRRPMVVLNDGELTGMIEGRRVLVTGAGGSIGSELCKQITRFKPAELVILDLSEFNLYTISNQLSEVAAELRHQAVLADVRDVGRICRLFDTHRPELVFHAAALKHVHLVEANADQGLLTNTIGTRNVADAAIAAGTLAFVQISTDKAVNPAGLMGASKRLAEYYTQSLDLAQSGPLNSSARTKFVTVRFGNVLGSSGSVVPLFQRQLEKGGPLTVTHPDMKRYFMTISEAVSLVLQASAYGIKAPQERGRVLVLDMGQPVRVLEIARQMIKMAGYRPDEDIKIEFIGLRPGEKLEEELFDDSEDLIQTNVPGILSARPMPLPLEELQPILNELADLARAGAVDQLKQRVSEIVPGCRLEKEPTGADVEMTVSTEPYNSGSNRITNGIPAIAAPQF